MSNSVRLLFVILVALVPTFGHAQGVGPTDAMIREAIKAECAKYYAKRGGSCLCYEECRRNSAYAVRQRAKRPVPFCNQSDISEDDVANFRNKEKRMIMERCDKNPPR